ncbi:MAG: hypothetical protein LBV66_00945 [Elusimicrobiota bacterium]|jgi:predicted Fe-Mo cluster-binding NifX family protein|nr:hypothetical protein [Elusimicrobiota bacterium]
MKIALASSDGKFIDLHFGKCGKWTIIDFNETDKTYKVLETRLSQSLCKDGGHSQSGIEDISAILKDCSFVITARIGIWVKQLLKEKGITVIENIGEIDSILKETAQWQKN